MSEKNSNFLANFFFQKNTDENLNPFPEMTRKQVFWDLRRFRISEKKREEKEERREGKKHIALCWLWIFFSFFTWMTRNICSTLKLYLSGSVFQKSNKNTLILTLLEITNPNLEIKNQRHLRPSYFYGPLRIP